MHADRHEEETRPRPREARTAAPTPAGPLPAVVARRGWVTAIQRTAGNRAATGALAGLVPVQRVDPPPAPAPALTPPGQGQDAPGREPRPDEVDHLLGVLPDLTEFRILREKSGAYNCFAWAVGIDSQIIGARSNEGYPNDNVESWTDWLKKTHGFGRFVDGFDPGAELLLYGSVGWIEHAARKAEIPYRALTFTSKLGGGNTESPVIQHAPHEIEGKQYGRIIRSLWREAAPAP